MQTLYKVAVYLHVVSAVIWIGGVLFMGIFAIPATKGMEAQTRRKIIGDLGRRFRPVGWACLTILVATGTLMLWRWGARWETLADLSFFAHGHTRLLGYKILAVVLMLAISFAHDFWLGPRALKEDRTPTEREHDRKLASIFGRVTAALVIIILSLAIFIARPWM